MNRSTIHNKQRIISMLLITLQWQLLTSCLKETADNIPEKVNRTVLFYMAGDNSLSEETQEKIDALCAAWQVTGDNHLLVYRDDADHLPQLLEIKAGADGKGVAEVLETYEEENSASAKVFGNVLTDVVLRYPAADYGLIWFSHSSGWLPLQTFVRPRSVGMDGQDEMELRSFAAVIPEGQFSFIIFESCLMAGAEVAYELSGKTEMLLASGTEIVSPGFTPLYGKLLDCLYRKRPALEEFAESYYTYCNFQQGDSRSATVSVIRPPALAPLKELLASAESRVEHWEWIDRRGLQHFDRRKSDYLFYDLEDYIRRIGSQDDINRLAGVLDAAVLYKAATKSFMPDSQYGFAINGYCGLTIYVPLAQYSYLNAQRELLKLFN